MLDTVFLHEIVKSNIANVACRSVREAYREDVITYRKSSITSKVQGKSPKLSSYDLDDDEGDLHRAIRKGQI
ncbi:hypothetical protein TNCV_4246651 [Trichonephila clavipes]|nr:hypothetical protein TNCV_4246651 [Trichonephila clavipes]